MPRKNLTARFCETVKVDERTDYQDEMVRGLALRVSPSGVKAWSVRYSRESDGSKQRITLGRFPAIPLEKARQHARKLVMAVAEGDDPSSDRKARKTAMTVADLGSLFIDKYAKRYKKTWAEDERILNADVYPELGRMKAVSVKRRDLLDIIEAKADAGHIAQSRQVLAVLRKMFGWAVDNDYLDVSPAAGIKPRGKAVKRDRVLSDNELRTIWNALPEASMANETRDIIRLLFLTGQRSGEVCGMVLSEIDLDDASWTIPKERTKNGIAHIVPLTQRAISLLGESVCASAFEVDRPIFSRIGAPIESNAISKAVRLKLQLFDEKWTPHDIRRTVATGMARIGVQPHIVEACLNHISGFRAGVAGTYNRATYDHEKRNAFDRWAQHIDGIVNEQQVVILPIKTGA